LVARYCDDTIVSLVSVIDVTCCNEVVVENLQRRVC